MHAMTHTPAAPARQRWMFLAVLLTIAALILSACGAKIETQPVSYTHLDVYKRQSSFMRSMLLEMVLKLVSIPPSQRWFT